MRLRCVALMNLHASRWGDYLEQGARLVTDLAGETGRAPSPACLGVRCRRRPAPPRPDDPRPAGAPVQGSRTAYQRNLTTRLTTPARTGREWAEVPPAGTLRYPRRGVLEVRLVELVAAGVDVTALVDQALAGRPLPTEVPADALLWLVGRARVGGGTTPDSTPGTPGGASACGAATRSGPCPRAGAAAVGVPAASQQ